MHVATGWNSLYICSLFLTFVAVINPKPYSLNFYTEFRTGSVKNPFGLFLED